MKQKDWLLLGGAALAVMLLTRKNEATSDGSGGALGGIGGAINGAIEGVKKAFEGATSASAAYPIVNAGGDINQALNSSRYSNLSVGAAQTLANVDFLNQIRGAEIVTAKIVPTASGSGLLALRGAAGVPTVQSQAIIDTAVRANTAATGQSYGVSLATGGANVFNITSQGTAATTTFAASTPSALSLASAYARGLM